jgi:hypothetical protein
MTRGEAVAAFIETYCRVPEGTNVGKKVELLDFQKAIILGIYYSDPPPRRVIVSMGRARSERAVTHPRAELGRRVPALFDPVTGSMPKTAKDPRGRTRPSGRQARPATTKPGTAPPRALPGMERRA